MRWIWRYVLLTTSSKLDKSIQFQVPYFYSAANALHSEPHKVFFQFATDVKHYFLLFGAVEFWAQSHYFCMDKLLFYNHMRLVERKLKAEEYAAKTVERGVKRV